jgi:deoxyribonuclease V
MKISELHPWDVTPEEAQRIQEALRPRLELEDRFRLADVQHVAGADNAYVRQEAGTTAYAAAIVLSFPQLAVVETSLATRPVTFPYVPGLLSFREAPAVLDAFRRLQTAPDVVLVDAHGYAHPRRMGFASHLGLLLGLPTIGCAKTKLTGRYEEPADRFGAWTPLIQRGEVIGAALRTRPGHSPLFVSVGTGVSLETAVEVALACCRGHFMPEPTRLAHNLVTKESRAARAAQPNHSNPH